MGTDLTLRAAGLYTDPNPHSDAPQGALRVADNVVIRRAGVLEPRPGFRPEGLLGGGRYVGIHAAPTGDTSEYYGQRTDELETDAATAVSMSGEVTGSITQTGEYAGAPVARLYERLYVPAVDEGVVAAVASGAARAAGLPRAGQPYISGTSTDTPAWLADDDAIAYRAVFISDVGDRIIVGPPSGRTEYRNETGAAVHPTVRIDLGGAIAGWQVQLYRSLAVGLGVTPSDEMYLCAEQQITAADVTSGHISIRDTATTSQLGTSLYTNATQDGALQENGRPPQAELTAAFNEMVFYGRVTEPHRLVLRFLEYPNLNTPDPTNISVTSGSPTFSLVSGQAPTVDSLGRYIVTDPSGTILANGADLNDYTWILDESPLTLSSDALGTNALLSVTLVDWIALDEDRNTPWTSYEIAALYQETRTTNLSTGTLDATNPYAALALAAAFFENVTPGIRVIATSDSLIFERPTSADGEIAVRLPPRFASLIEATPPSYTTIAATGTTAGARNLPESVQYLSDQAERINRVYYSKKQQPEHVPPVNFVDIGADSEPILAMRATRRALFVFKTDGIWIIQGDTPETLRVTQIDSTARLLHPKAVAVGGDRVFAWTDAGVVMLGEGGVGANLSAPAIEPDLRDIQVALQATSDPASGSTLGCFLSYQDGEERLLLGVPAAVGDDMVDSVYQYDMRTQAWTRWTTGDREYSASTTIAGRILFAGQTGDTAEGEVWRETLASDEAPHADVAVTDAISSASTASGVSTVELVGSAADWPVGTWCYQPNLLGGSRGVVIESDAGTDTIRVAMMEGSISAVGDYSPLQGYQPVEQCIEWVAKTAQVPTVTKHWQRGVLTYESDRRMYDATLSFRSDMVHTASSVTTSHILQNDPLPEDVPFLVTRAHARSAVLLPKLCISQGGARWALSALHLDYELGSSRAGRRTR